MKTDKIIYPLVVVNDRYMGTYSGGEWVALNCYPEDVPEAIFGDDSECFDFWMRWNERKGRSVIPIAVGNTCEEAIEKLREFIAQH